MELDAPAAVGTWRVPEPISLDGNQLQWSSRGVPIDRREAGPQLGLLQKFVALRTGDPGATLRFAQRWGVLDLCLHGLPASHAPCRALVAASAAARPIGGYSPADEPSPADDPPCRPSRLRLTAKSGVLNGFARPGHSTGSTEPIDSAEPVERWQHFASEADAILRIAASLKTGEPASTDTWQPLKTLLGAPVESVLGVIPDQDLPSLSEYRRLEAAGVDVLVPRTRREELKNQRRLLATTLQTWLDMGDVRMLAVPTGAGVRLEFGSTCLFGALALQLALAVTGSGLAMCASCTDPYIPKRKPRAGERTYCEECGPAAARRDGARRARERKREERDRLS